MAIHLKPVSEQTIVITGASSGIGLTTAKAAARAGARVMLAARDGDALAKIVAELNAAGGETAFQVTDVSQEADVNALAAAAVSRYGGFDTWVNDAGVGLTGTLDRVSTEDHHRIFEVNYFGIVYGSLAAARHFRVTSRSGAIVNLGSTVSDMSIAMEVPYAATKHAIKGFTDGLRIELAREGLPVSVTLIKPSAIDTPFFDHSKTTMGGIGQAPGPQYAPDVVARAILHAAAHPRRDIAVGSTSALGGRVNAVVPQFIDRNQEKIAIEDLIDFGQQPTADSLNEVPREGAERSRRRLGRHVSATTFAQTLSGLTLGLLSLAAVAVALLLPRER